MQTSSSSNESRSSARKVVASYSNCALAQKPVYTSSSFPAAESNKSKKVSQTQMPSKNMVASIISSSGKSSISPLSETENKVIVFDREFRLKVLKVCLSLFRHLPFFGCFAAKKVNVKKKALAVTIHM